LGSHGTDELYVKSVVPENIKFTSSMFITYSFQQLNLKCMVFDVYKLMSIEHYEVLHTSLMKQHFVVTHRYTGHTQKNGAVSKVNKKSILLFI
jgi:hypothetical protein